MLKNSNPNMGLWIVLHKYMHQYLIRTKPLVVDKNYCNKLFHFVTGNRRRQMQVLHEIVLQNIARHSLAIHDATETARTCHRSSPLNIWPPWTRPCSICGSSPSCNSCNKVFRDLTDETSLPGSRTGPTKLL